MTPTPPNTPVDAGLVAFWADQLAPLSGATRGSWLAALASSHGARFADRVRELLTQERAA